MEYQATEIPIFHFLQIKPTRVRAKIPYVNVQMSNNLSITDGFNSQPFSFHDPNMSAEKNIAIARLVSTSKSLFQINTLEYNEIILMATNPTLVNPDFRTLIEVGQEGVLQPTDIPDLSDLALLPKALKCYYQWLLESSNDDNIIQHLAEIQSHCSTTLSLNQEEFYMSGGCHEMTIASYSNVIKTVSFNSNMINSVTVLLETNSISEDWRDGRTTTLTMQLNDGTPLPKVGCKKRRSNDSVKKVVIWNCRGMGKATFRLVYDYIVNCHSPYVVILTESRVSAVIGKAILRSTPNPSMKLLEPIGITGGAVVVSVNREVRLRMQSFHSACAINMIL